MVTIPLLSLADTLRARSPVFAAWISAAEPSTAEALMGEAFDAAVLDMQHGELDAAATAAVIGACASLGKPAIVRVPVGDFATASRMLDAGAAGIIAPMIGSAEEAAAFAAFVKYPPLGTRSWGPGRATRLAGAAGGDYLHKANGLHLAIAMIETAAGLDAIDAILAVPGIDGVYVGPSDLSISLSHGAEVAPASVAVDEALVRVESAAKAAGKFSGLFCFDGAEAAGMAARGFSLLTIATDIMLMRQAARVELDRAKGIAQAPLPRTAAAGYQ